MHINQLNKDSELKQRRRCLADSTGVKGAPEGEIINQWEERVDENEGGVKNDKVDVFVKSEVEKERKDWTGKLQKVFQLVLG